MMRAIRFETGLVVGVVLVCAARGCAAEAGDLARWVGGTRDVAAPVAAARPIPKRAAEARRIKAPIPTIDAEDLPRVPVRVEDLPHARSR